MSSSTVSLAILASLLFVSTTMGHSQMRCAKYNPKTGECYAPIRNSAVSFQSEAHDISANGAPLCQSPWTNPITSSYANGDGCPSYASCPLPMGTYTPGESFYVQWVARNHAVADQTPGNISMYISPSESVNQGFDVSAATFRQGKFCTAPFMSCNGQNGDLVPCSAPCTMPSNLASGTYTLWWKWEWPGHTSVYSTCADIQVVANGNAPAPTPAPAQPSTTGAKAAAQPSPAPAPVTPAPVPTPTPTPAPQPSPAPTPAPAPVTPSPAPSSGSCASGYMKCLTSETYSTCGNGKWGGAQSCGSGTQCSPSGNYIYCLRPSNNTPAPAPTPVPTPAPTPVTPTPTPTPSSNGKSCSTPGYQRCSGDSTYQTCGNGKSGYEWSANQKCQSGLSCHASSTANNIYCY